MDRTPRPPRTVRKRDGRVVPYDPGHIARAIERAAREVGRRDLDVASLVGEVGGGLAARFGRSVPGVEDVQDDVERALMLHGLDDVVRAYVVYRNRKAELRHAKEMIGVRDELKLSFAACVVLGDRYLRRGERGVPVESTGEMVDRVARHVAAAEDAYRPRSAARWADEFRTAMAQLELLPNSPTLMNAGTPLGLLSACFVLPLDDSLDSIFTTLHRTALLHQAGAGTGFAFSHLRPSGDRVQSTGGVATGPVSFVDLFDHATDVVGRGGRRRGANMAVLHVSHPDIVEFVDAKRAPGRLAHCNLSVGVTDGFMRAARRGARHRLVNPRTGDVVGEVDAAALFDRIVSAAWASGDPGLLFLDRIERANPLPGDSPIEATNPCGEVPLRPNESCTLASVNLARHVRGGHVDWAHLDGTVARCVRFLDDVLDVNRYPSPELETAAHATRKIGVGVMGLAELLAMLGIPYDSVDAVRLGGRIASRIRRAARSASACLAAERGPFPRFADSVHAAAGVPLRHAQLTSVAPTGTISLIAGTTSGIEPMFAIAYVRRVVGRSLVEVNPLFERVARDEGFWSDALIARVAASGTVRDEPTVPADVRRAFVTAHEVAPSWHLRMQAAVQRHVDAAVAKTVNLPADATEDDVRRIYTDAWRAGVKGITVYRDGSRPDQVLRVPTRTGEPISVDVTYAGGCASTRCMV